MSVRSQRIWARVVLAVCVCAGLAWLLRLDRQAKISTDVLDLVPEGRRQPELALVRSLASERQGRVVLFSVAVGEAEGEAADAAKARAAAVLAGALKDSGRFEEVCVMEDVGVRRGLARTVYERRLDLLFPQWLAAQLDERARQGGEEKPAGAWLAEQSAAALEQYLTRPEAIAFQDLMPSDPLLLMPGLLDRLNGAGLPGAGRSQAGLVWALQKEKPLLEAGQAPVFAAVARAEEAMRAAEPGSSLRWTGVARFAAESRARIERELGWLNSASLLLVAAVAALCLSRAIKALHLVPPVLAGLLGAWVFTTLCFDRVHVLVFVVGSLLGGVAVDYGVYLYLQPPAYPEESYAGKLRRLIKPLLASALTTVLGFSLLLASELPLIRQLGVFVSAGLLCSLAAAILWFGQLHRHHLPARPLVARRPADGPFMRGLGLVFLGVVLVLALAGPWLLTWKDNIRQLEVPAPELHDNDRAVRGLFGEGGGSQVYLTRGDDLAAARRAWSRFSAWQSARPEAAPLVSLALVVPEEAQWLALPARIAELGDFETELRAALLRHGFEEGAFEPFFKAWSDWRGRPLPAYEPMVAAFVAELQGPSTLLLSTAPGSSWFASVIAGSEPLEPPAELDTLGTSQLESLNRLFTQYRRSALRLSVIGLSLVGLSVFALYGLRRGLRVFAIPVGASLCGFGLLGFAGQTLNLFHLLGAFLGVCLSHNYAIFSTENSLRGEGAPPSIRLSALTTALSFGVLSFSQIPVVAALGSSVALIVLFALLIVEFEPFLPGGRPPGRPDALQLESDRRMTRKEPPHV